MIFFSKKELVLKCNLQFREVPIVSKHNNPNIVMGVKMEWDLSDVCANVTETDACAYGLSGMIIYAISSKLEMYFSKNLKKIIYCAIVKINLNK